MKNKFKILSDKFINNLPEVVFLSGFIMISFGFFKIGTVVGLIATGLMLMILSVILLGGD